MKHLTQQSTETEEDAEEEEEEEAEDEEGDIDEPEEVVGAQPGVKYQQWTSGGGMAAVLIQKNIRHPILKNETAFFCTHKFFFNVQI